MPTPSRDVPSSSLKEMVSLLLIGTSARPDRKKLLGEHLYPLVSSALSYSRGSPSPKLSAKVTGMLLELPEPEVLSLLESRDRLGGKVNDAADVLVAHDVKNPNTLEAGLLEELALPTKAAGKRLYAIIGEDYPDLAGKITGMLLELPPSEVRRLLLTPSSLTSKVSEALTVLDVSFTELDADTSANVRRAVLAVLAKEVGKPAATPQRQQQLLLSFLFPSPTADARRVLEEMTARREELVREIPRSFPAHVRRSLLEFLAPLLVSPSSPAASGVGGVVGVVVPSPTAPLATDLNQRYLEAKRRLDAESSRLAVVEEQAKVLEQQARKAADAAAAREKLLLDGALRLEREKAETARLLKESQKAEEAQKGLAHATEEKYKKSVEELKEQLENVQQAKLCNICWEEEKRVALQPCGHVCICTTCSVNANLQACPLCRTAIQGRFSVFV